MSRPLCFVLGITLLAAAPARGQDLLEAFVEGFVDGMNGANNNNGYNNNGYNNNGYNNNGYNNNGYNNNGYNNNGYNHNSYNNHGYNNYQPVRPNSGYQKVWNGSHWEYIQNSPSVVYPSTTVVSPATTVSTAVVSNALPYKGPGVTIALEEEVGGSVNYMIDGKESASIQAGQQQTLTNKGKYEIRFSRGTSEDGRNFGEARYTITEGNYHFTVTDKGWELLRDKQQPNLITTQIQQASPSGIKTNALPPKTAPAAAAQPAVPAAALAPGVLAAPAANAIPAANAVPAAPAAAPAVPAATAVPAANALPAANTVPAPPAPAAG